MTENNSSEPMKILIVTASTKGGGASHILDLIKGLKNDGYQVHFMGPDNGPFFTPIKDASNETLEIPIRKNPGKAFTQILNYARNFRPDIIHTHGKGGGALGRAVGPLLGIPVVHTFHGLHYKEYGKLKQKAYFGLEKALSQTTTMHIAVGHQELIEAKKLGFCASDNSVVIPNGVDFKRFESRDQKAAREAFHLPKEKFILGAITRITPIKGLKELINGFVAAYEQDNALHLVIAGDSDGDSEYSKNILEYKSHPAISFLGFQTDVPGVYSALDVYISAALSEGLPLSLIEACASKTLPVVSDIPAHQEILGEEASELLFASQDESAITRKILWVKNLPADKKNKLSKMLHERASATYSLERMIEETKKIYQKARRASY